MQRSMLMALLVATTCAEAAFAQAGAASERDEAASQQESPEEVVVRGRRLSDLRYEVQAAREHAFALFNELNSNDDFDIFCRNERKYHSRATQRVCRARFESNIQSAAAQEYMRALFGSCRPDVDGFFSVTHCMFSNFAEGARSRAQAIEGEAEPKFDALSEEIWRIANEHEEFAQAIVDYFDLSQQYRATTSRRRKD